MAKARRLTEVERLHIAKERSEGVSARELASRYGVSTVSVYNAVHHASGRRISNGSRTRVLNLRVSEAELRAFDASLSRRGITHRTDALRRFVMAADGFLAPDEHMTDELRSLCAALNRVGNNINQIARTLNSGEDADIPELREALQAYLQLRDAIFDALGMEPSGDNQGRE